MENSKLNKVRRFEVIDDNGRSYVNLNVKHIYYDFQDDNRTLKIFITSKQNEEKCQKEKE